MRFALVVTLLFFSLMQEGATVPKPKENPQWYDKVVGVIGIPAALIGCAYAYLLIKKTRLESQKIELELEEKRQLLSQTKPSSSTVGEQAALDATATVEEALKNQLYLMLLIRYILWQLVEACYLWLITPIGWISNFGFTVLLLFASKHFDINALMERYLEKHEGMAVPMALAVRSFSGILPQLGSLVIFLAFGWPLFKDINRVIGIKWADYRPMTLVRTAFQKKQVGS